MAEVTAPVLSFSSSGPSLEYCVPICSTTLTVLPDDNWRSSGSVGLLARKVAETTIVMHSHL